MLGAYAGALWLMVFFLTLVVLVDWPGLDLTSRPVFSGLLVLAIGAFCVLGGRFALHRLEARANITSPNPAQ
jgi:hypothetical protein